MSKTEDLARKRLWKAVRDGGWRHDGTTDAELMRVAAMAIEHQARRVRAMQRALLRVSAVVDAETSKL